MDYEKAYKEALKRAKGFKTDEYKDVAEYIFQELAESEDERIRKALIRYFTLSDEHAYYEACGVSYRDIVAWLEKQGEQKPADKVEPKFKIGDWVIDKQGIVHQIANVIENVTNHTYSYDIVDGGYFNDNTEGVRLWTIRDAKDGTVLVASDGSIFLFKDRVYSACKYYIALTTDGAVKFNNDGLEHYWETVTAVHPATKEQRDLLFQKMKEAGYEWDAEKKELKNIERKSTEWDEEDERYLSYAIHAVEDMLGNNGKNTVTWLKSLKERYTWRPSDEQMDALRYVTNFDYGGHKAALVSLYEQLKKLKD